MTLQLRLTARLSYIDNKLQFVTDDPDTVSKLQRHSLGRETRMLLDLPTREFSVKTGRPQTCAEYSGRDCSILVRLKPFKFTSKLDFNRGQTVTGLTMELLDIEPAGQ